MSLNDSNYLQTRVITVSWNIRVQNSQNFSLLAPEVARTNPSDTLCVIVRGNLMGVKAMTGRIHRGILNNCCYIPTVVRTEVLWGSCL
jgi:hypothetical protein